MLLSGKHAVVTGGGTGIGLAITNALVAEGATVTIMGRNKDRLDDVAETHTLINAVKVDVTDEDSVKKAFQEASSIAPIDFLINNAGAAKSAPFHKISHDDWQQAISVNLNSVYLTSYTVFDQIKSRDHGRIINIASTAGLMGSAYASAYSAAKHGVVGLTRSIAMEITEGTMTGNAICPGFTNTDIITNSIQRIVAKTGRREQDALNDLLKAGDQYRLVEPEEIAEEVIRLCDPANDDINGEAIIIDGNAGNKE